MEQLKIKKASEAAPHERPENAESAWEFSKKTSRYHFRTDVIDPRWDCVQGIGRFVGDWTQELEPLSYTHLTCRRLLTCTSRWSPYH